MFVNRDRELADLAEWWERPQPRPALVWGRRRVGKTALIQQFAKDHRVAFHTGAGRSARGELVQLSRQAASALASGVRDLANRPYVDWDDALEHLSEAARDEPLYLSWWDSTADVVTNLRRLVCRPGAPLLIEGDLVLATEAEAGDQPAAVLHAIANGKTRHNEIKDWVRAEPTRTLDRLTDLRLVSRVVPVTEDPDRSRRRVYRVADNFLAFYLGLVSRYRAEIDRGLGESILGVLLQGLDHHLGHSWEEAVRAHVRRECAAGRLAADVVAVGSWWSGDGQDEIDVLALAGRSRTPILAGEVKWTPSVEAPRLVNDLRRKVQRGIATDPDALRYLVAARETVRDAGQDTVGVTTTDVFRPS